MHRQAFRRAKKSRLLFYAGRVLLCCNVMARRRNGNAQAGISAGEKKLSAILCRTGLAVL